MGYISKEIVTDTVKPAKLSLSGVSNFLEFAAGEDTAHTYTKTKLELQIKQKTYSQSAEGEEAKDDDIGNTRFTVYEAKNKAQSYTFKGTLNPDHVDDKTFLVVNNDIPVVAENIRACLLKSPFFKNKFSITIPFVWDGNKAHNGDTIHIESLGAGDLYRFSFGEPTTLNPSFMVLTGNPELGDNNDRIDYGLGNKDIEVDVYTDTGIFLGEADNQSNTVSLGTYLTTLSKSYFGQPIWFDVNALFSSNKIYSDRFLQSGSKVDNKPVTWVDAGTVNDLRLVAKTHDGTRRETFYYSQVLYVLTGYARALDGVDMNQYIFEHAVSYPAKMKPLTNQPPLTHLRGQSQYFNFIFSDPLHSASAQQTTPYHIGISYQFYTPSGKKIAARRSLMQPKDRFGIVNTVKLDMDEVIEKTEADFNTTVGIVKVYLCDDMHEVSQPLEYKIMPRCLYKVNDFAFLNALGGWSSFNFGGEKSVAVKSEPNTIYKSIAPRYTISSQIESVFDKDVQETFTVKTLPVTAQVADWLKELTASLAVYELSTGRYVVIDDFDIKHSTDDNLFVLEMKYRYSGTYNAAIK